MVNTYLLKIVVKPVALDRHCWHRGRPEVQHIKKTLTTDPLENTCKTDEVSPEVEAGGVVGLKCLQPSWDTDL
jgi:hypothetical protein